MNQRSKEGENDIAQSGLDQDATTKEHLKFQIFCNLMFSSFSCLF